MNNIERILSALEGLPEWKVDSITSFVERERFSYDRAQEEFLRTAEGQNKPRCEYEEECSMGPHSAFERCKLPKGHSGFHECIF